MDDLVAPFRGERFAAADRLSRLIAPPYDVIDAAERVRLAALDADNIVHVMLPEAPPGQAEDQRYRAAAALLAAWRRTGVLRREGEPTWYVLAQDFTLPTGERRTRRGVFVAAKAEGYEPRRIRPHERTHAGPKADRLALLRATATNIESIFLLAPDRDRALANALAAVAQSKPDATAELNGVGIRLWVVRDVSRIPLLAAPLYIADGHHRYETASAYSLENRAADRVLALVVSAQAPGLAVLPTHRVIFGAGRDLDRLLPRWRGWFDIQAVPAGGGPVAPLAAVGRDRTARLVPGRSRHPRPPPRPRAPAGAREGRRGPRARRRARRVLRGQGDSRHRNVDADCSLRRGCEGSAGAGARRRRGARGVAESGRGRGGGRGRRRGGRDAGEVHLLHSEGAERPSPAVRVVARRSAL